MGGYLDLQLIFNILKNHVIFIILTIIFVFVILSVMIFLLSKFLNNKNRKILDLSSEPVIIDNIFYPDDVIKTVISFIVSCYEKDKLKIGKKKDKNDIFISFGDKALAEFLQDFFVVCKSKDEGMLSDAAYKSFINNFWASYEKSKEEKI